jgi:hypothetical protein
MSDVYKRKILLFIYFIVNINLIYTLLLSSSSNLHHSYPHTQNSNLLPPLLTPLLTLRLYFISMGHGHAMIFSNELIKYKRR